MCLFFEDDKITLSESKRGIFMLAEKNIRVVVRGAGDLASGVIAKLYRSGFEVAAWSVRSRPLSGVRFLFRRRYTKKK